MTPASEEPEVTANPMSWGAVAVKWVFGQPSIVVALFAILAAMVWIAHQSATVWMPSHLIQIQTGYERAIDRFDAARDKEIAADKEARQEYRDLLIKQAADERRAANEKQAAELIGP